MGFNSGFKVLMQSYNSLLSNWKVHNYFKSSNIILIIIIIWHYNPLWVFAFSAKSLQVLLSLAASFQPLTFNFFRSSVTTCFHRCLVFPTGLFPIVFQSSSFLVGFAWSILWICPSHLILCALMNLTIRGTVKKFPELWYSTVMV